MRRFPLLLCTLLLAACSTSDPIVDEPDRTTPDAYPFHTVDQIRQSVALSTGAVRAYAADGDIELVSPERDDRADHSVRSRLADSTTFNVRGPLGITVLRSLVTPDSFLVYNRFMREFIIGRVEAAEQFLPGAGSADIVSRALVGLLVPDASAWEVTPREGNYLLVSRREDGSRRVLIVDPSIWRVIQAQEINGDNAVVADQRFSEFDTVEGIVFPRRVVLTAPEEGIRVVMDHARLVPNPADLRLRFSRPDTEPIIIR
ncbi:MAG: DUF4292 domain-containing protein [Bacteroidota bacterium]